MSAARILVVDDEASVAFTLQAVLQQEGYQVDRALSGAEALAYFESERYDAALIDLRIEEADGIDLVRALLARQPFCSAIILTGYASLESAVRAIREGAYDYLMKPCDLDELKLTLARAVERSGLRRALEERVIELERANATIRELNEDLERRIAARTEDLVRAVADLAAARERIEALHKQRLEFVSMIAHELGQPLTAIQASVQLLDRSSIDAEKRARLQAGIASASQRLRRLIQDLGDVARISADEFRLEISRVDLAELAQRQAELARQLAERHTVVYDGPPADVAVECDPDRVAQVLANLLSNAIKYTPGGQIRLELGIEGGRARIAVRDEGPGIPPERQETIFEPHVRLTPAGGERPQGAGLGLYIARSIAAAHGGRLWVESREARGSTFWLELPLHAPGAPTAGAATSSA
jgi:signal transduction histidine kinase